MKKILFIPVNNIQLELFINIFHKLDKDYLDIKFLCMDCFYEKKTNIKTEEIMKKHNLPFKNVDSYSKISPRHIFDSESPDIIVNSQDAMDPFVKKISKIAHKKGVPVLVIQDAFMFYGNPNYNSPEQNPEVYFSNKVKKILIYFMNIKKLRTYGPDWKTRMNRIFQICIETFKGESSRWGDGNYTKIAVMGNYFKQMLIDRGIEENSIVIIGQPRWDKLIEAKKSYGALTISPIEKESISVLLTTQPLVESNMWTEKDREDYIINIIKEIKKIKKSNLVIKLHPRDTWDAYKKIINDHKLNDFCKVCELDDLNELIVSCDVMLTHLCTTAIEAMILGKPVIAVDFKYSTHEMPYVKCGAAIPVDKYGELSIGVNNLIYDSSLRRKTIENANHFVYECSYLQDGLAAQRAAKLIMNLLD